MKTNSNRKNVAFMTVSQLPYGQHACVQHVRAVGELGRRLRDMGLVSGTTLSVLSRAPLGDPLVVGLDGFNLSLRLSEADQIEVSPVMEKPASGSAEAAPGHGVGNSVLGGNR